MKKTRNRWWIQPWFLLALVYGVILSPSVAQEPPLLGGEFQVNTHTSLSQTYPSVSAAANGEFVVVWQSFLSEDEDFQYVHDVRGQRYDQHGEPLGEEFLIGAPTSKSKFNPSVAMAASGEFVVVWSLNGEENGYYVTARTIQGQRFGSDGATQGGEFVVHPEGYEYLWDPVVVANAQGEFVVTWMNHGEAYLGVTQAQKFSSDGTEVGDLFRVDLETGKSFAPSASIADNGTFTVVWESRVYDRPDFNYTQAVRGQQFASDGTPKGDQFTVRTDTTGQQFSPRVANDKDGNFAVVWASLGTDDEDTEGWSVQARRYGSDGMPKSESFLVNSYTTGRQSAGDLSMAPSGDFLVTWASAGADLGDTSGTSIQGQIYDAEGGRQGDQFQVNTYTPNWQTRPSVAVDDQGGAVVAWQSLGSTFEDESDWSIQAQRLRILECSPTETGLCLLDNRFEVEVDWRDFADGTGYGRVVPLGMSASNDSGLFYFFDPDNWEMLVKMVDGCGFNDHYWFFLAATTNVEYTVTVTDTTTGLSKEYTNSLGVSSPAVTDTEAFAVCPTGPVVL